MLRVSEKPFHCGGRLLFSHIQYPLLTLRVMETEVCFGEPPLLDSWCLGSAWADHTAHIQGMVCDPAGPISIFHSLAPVTGSEMSISHKWDKFRANPRALNEVIREGSCSFCCGN